MKVFEASKRLSSVLVAVLAEVEVRFSFYFLPQLA